MFDDILWEKGARRVDYGYGKEMFFPKIPWGKPGERELVPLIPDGVSQFDESVEPTAYALGNETLVVDHSHKSAFAKYGHFGSLFDEELKLPASAVDGGRATADLVQALNAWNSPVNHVVNKFSLKYPKKVAGKKGQINYHCASKNVLVASANNEGNRSLIFWNSVGETWCNPNVKLADTFGIAISSDSRFLVVFDQEKIACWSVEGRSLRKLWEMKPREDEKFIDLNEFNVTVSSDFVVFEYPSSSLQTHSTVDGKFISAAFSTPEVRSLDIHVKYLLVSGVANSYQLFTVHAINGVSHWLPKFFLSELSFRNETVKFELPPDTIWFTRLKGEKAVILTNSFLMAMDFDEVRPIRRLQKGVFVAAEIAADYLLTLEHNKQGEFKFCMSRFTEGSVVTSLDIPLTKEPLQGQRSFIFATATHIKLALFDGTMVSIKCGVPPLAFHPSN